MKNFDTRVYSISDFMEWYNNDLLELSPDFQRRSVWSEQAKSYLTDTIIRGKPIPKILISQRLEGKRTIRVVVDGQQRLRTIIGFINGDFKISRAHNKQFAGYVFDRLPQESKDDFLQYELGVDLLFNISYEDILDIFARINSYTVTLNKQEKINAKYLGYFKQYAFRYGYKYVRYFIDGKVLTKAKVTRMAEADLVADLFVSLVGGIQTNKNVEQYYKKFEDEIGNFEDIASRFDKVMSFVGAIYPPEELAETNWARNHLFYTLFTSLAHFLYAIEGPQPDLRTNITETSVGKLRVRLDEISAKYDEISNDIDNPNHPAEYKRFIDHARRKTTDTSVRIARTNFVCEKMLSALT